MPTFVPVASKAQVIGEGTVLSIGGVTGATGTPTFNPIGEINSFKFPPSKRNTASATNFDSGSVLQYLGTTLDLGELSGTYNRVSNNAGQMALIAAAADGRAYDFKLQCEPNALIGQITTGDLYAFSGIVTEAGGFDADQTKFSTSTFSIKINSSTFTAGA